MRRAGGVAALAVLSITSARAELLWTAYDTTGAMLAGTTFQQAATFNAAANSYTLTVPANTAVTFVTTNFIPIDLAKPASGSTLQSITFQVSSDTMDTLNKYRNFGLFNFPGSLPDATSNQGTSASGLWVTAYNNNSTTYQSKPCASPSASGAYSLSIGADYRLASPNNSQTSTGFGLGTSRSTGVGIIASNTVYDVTFRPTANTAGTTQVGTNTTDSTLGGLWVDDATGGTVFHQGVKGSTTNCSFTCPNYFNGFAFYFDNTGNSNPATLVIANLKAYTSGGSGFVMGPAYFTSQPPSTVTVSTGSTITIPSTVVATTITNGPTSALQWQYSADGTTYSDIDTVGNPSAATATLSISNADTPNAGFYRLKVTTSYTGTVAPASTLTAYSTSSNVTVQSAGVAPSFTTQPAGTIVLVGNNTTLTTIVSGTTPITYQWMYSADNGATDPFHAVSAGNVTGTTDTTLTVTGAMFSNTGYYRLDATNSVGTTSSNAVLLSVDQVPSFTTPAAGSTTLLNAGDSTTLTIATTATPAATYQWKKNGVAISGATSASYMLSNAQTADAGNYTCVATNEVGSTTSPVFAIGINSAMVAAQFAPANGASSINPDSPLTITFSDNVGPGVFGKIYIWDASNTGSPVETIDMTALTARLANVSVLGVPVQTQTIGNSSTPFNYYPVLFSGNTATIYPKHTSLTYGKTYYVTMDAGAVVDSAGAAFAGISSTSAWTFTTKAAAPTAGTTLVTVAADGSGDFNTVQGALDWVPNANTTPTTIFVKNGTYTELVYFTNKHALTILGESRSGTIIGYRNNDAFDSGTSKRPAFQAQSVNNLVIANLTIKNFTPKTGSQAEALYLNLSMTAQAIVTNVNLSSYQDTLNINGQVYITDSYIEGDTDFMWGNGPVFFNNCELKALSIQSYYTQVRNPATNHGFVYLNCTLDAAAGDSQNPANPVSGCYLGRLDQNTNPHTEMVLLNCLLGTHILPVAWNLNGQSLSGVTATNCVEYNSRNISDNSPVDVSQRATWSYQWTSPTNDTQIANYSSPTWVLGGTWTPALTPLVLTQPAGATLMAGNSATLTVSAIGIPAPTYQWKKNGVAITGATSASYTIPTTISGDSGSYTVDITNASGTVTSSAATLAVSGPPTITTQPSAYQGVAAGSPVSFTVVAVDSGAMTYQWQLNGTDILGATSATLTLSNPRSTDSGTYTVNITGPNGTTTSTAAHLAVAASGGLVWQSYDQSGNRISADAAQFTPSTGTYTLTIPANTVYTFVTKSFVPLVLSKPASGSNNLPVSFSMLASGGYGTNGSVQFHYTGFGLFNDGGTAPAAAGNFTDDKGLWIELYQSANAVSMKPQSVTSTVPNCPVNLMALNINSPYGMGTGTGGNLGTINDGVLVDMTVRPSASTSGQVTLGTSSSSAATSGGVLLDHATGGTTLNRRVYSSGSTGLSVASTSITFNEFGYQFDNATASDVTIQLSNFSGITIAPYFTTQPQAHGTFTVGDTVTLATTAVGASSYQWQISTDGGTTFVNIDTTANPSAATATLTLSNAQTSDSAIYQLVATNAAGSTTSVQTTVVVTTTPFAPVIEVQPMGATKLAGSSFALSVTASASVPATYQWYKDGNAVSGGTSGTLSFASLAPTDAGNYTVTITNGLGSATSNAATLVVQYVPIITAQPTGANVSAGSPVTLSVTVDALPAATYQWKKNGVAIGGATSSTYMIASAAATDTANYTVTVTNLAGNVTSSIAAVNVLSSSLAVSSSSVISATSGGAYPESPITVNFNQAIAAGLTGAISIYDAANPGTPVDTISFVSGATRTSSAALFALPMRQQTIGGLSGFSYYPVIISGSTATIYPANGVLTYGKSYYVTIDPGVFTDSTGLAFAGVSSPSAITFSTKAAGPTNGTTSLVVAKDGSGDFCTVQAALDWIPAANTTPITLSVQNGTYYEIVYWTTKNNITILGQSRTGTIIGYPNNNTLNPQGTNGRAAFEGRNSSGTVIGNLTIKNFTAYGGSQAEAIYLNNTDLQPSTIVGINLSSYQDTLNINGPVYIADSYIEGDTDFMWGNGPVFFQNCELHMLHSTTYYTQVRNPATNHGFVYSNCLFSAEAGITGSYLGRLNQNAPAYTEVVLLNCREADTTLNVLGWDPNGITDKSTSLCVEYNPTKQSDGTPVSVSGRVSWSYQWTSPTNDAQIANYSNPYWVLNTQKDGTAKSTPTTWTPSLAPIIVSQPVGTSTTAGNPVTLSVTAIGAPSPLTYQWKKDGVTIPGATSATYAIASATHTATGNYTVDVTSTGGVVSSTAAAVTVTDGFTSFLNTYNLTGSNALTTADPDGDGISNLLEYVLGGDPTTASRSNLPTSSMTTVSGQPALVFSYNVKTAAAAVVGVSVEYSSDLVNWTTASDGQNGITISTTVVDANTNHVVVTIPTSSAKLFARLHLNY